MATSAETLQHTTSNNLLWLRRLAALVLDPASGLTTAGLALKLPLPPLTGSILLKGNMLPLFCWQVRKCSEIKVRWGGAVKISGLHWFYDLVLSSGTLTVPALMERGADVIMGKLRRSIFSSRYSSVLMLSQICRLTFFPLLFSSSFRPTGCQTCKNQMFFCAFSDESAAVRTDICCNLFIFLNLSPWINTSGVDLRFTTHFCWDRALEENLRAHLASYL